MAHLYKLGIENFRVFKEYTEFEFAPITILTGANNSGKSSVIKAIQLLKQNLAHRNSESDLILSFISDEHKLGSFEDVVYDSSKPLKLLSSTVMDDNDEIMSIAFTYLLDNNSKLGEGLLDSIELYSSAGNLIFKYKRSGEAPHVFTDYRYFFEKMLKRIRSFNEYFLDYEKLEGTNTNLVDPDLIYHPYRLQSYFLINPPRKQGKLRFNPIPFTYRQKSKDIFPKLYDITKTLSPTLICFLFIYLDIIDVDILINKYLVKDNNVTDEILKSYLKIELGDTEERILSRIKEGEDFTIELLSIVERDNKWHPRDVFGFNNLFEVHIKSFFPSLEKYLFDGLILSICRKAPKEDIDSTLRKLQSLSRNLDKENIGFFLYKYLSDNIRYLIRNAGNYYERVYKIDSLRANTQRLYTYSSQGTSFNSLLLESLQKNLLESPNHKRFLSKWLDNFGIKGELEINNIQPGIGMQITLGGRPLADLGYGLTQLIPILLKIVATEDIYHDDDFRTHDPNIDFYISYTIVIEEPETNLHPKYQSLLADLIIDASWYFCIQFIVETHSEYLIRKLQYLTAKGEIKPADTSIYYFYHPDEKPIGEKQVKKIEIMDDGSLSDDFGPGFFDEAINWKFELLKLKNKN